MKEKTTIETYFLWHYCYSMVGTVLRSNIWQKLEPKLWTNVEPKPKIYNFGSATPTTGTGMHKKTK